MRIAIDAVGIRGHGGAAVLSELIHWLSQVRLSWQWHLFVFEQDLREFELPVIPESMTIHETRKGNTGWDRVRWVNRRLVRALESIKPDLLFSFANIAPADDVNFARVVYIQQRNALFSEPFSLSAIRRCVRMRVMRSHIMKGAMACDALIVQTESMRDRLLTLASVTRDHVHVIPSGYCTPKVDPVIRDSVQAALADVRRPRLVYLSHPCEHKNYEVLLRALPAVAEQFPEVRLYLTVERNKPPHERYRRLMQKIVHMAEACEVADRIVWLGRLSSDEVFHVLQVSDMMVFPSLSESFGLGLVDAMAAGCPVLAADLRYAHDVCGPAAQYFDPTCPKELARILVGVWGDPQLRERMVRLGNERKVDFGYETIAERIAHVFESVVYGAGTI